jgi:hypothetical protein
MTARRIFLRALGPALLLAAGLALSTHGAQAADLSVAHADGYLSVNGSCMMLRQHDGQLLALRGYVRGLLPSDHVRLEGHFAPDPGCGAPGFEVTKVQTVWGDDNHRTTYYDHLNGEPFERFAARTGRLSYESDHRAYQSEQRTYDNERRSYENERDRYNAGSGYSDRNNAQEGYRQEGYREQNNAQEGHRAPEGTYYERGDRNGRYVYQGPHRRVTLVGKLHEVEHGCPTLHAAHTTVALDGNLGNYQAGDNVKVEGTLWDHDSDAPCGGPTLVIHSIRGYHYR